MSGQGGEAPKIIIDSDWKSQAQAEREKLAEAEAKAQAEAAARGPGAPAGDMQGLPPADFRTLIEMLAMQALMYLGGVADRRTGQAVFDPDYSKHMIDLLGVLEAKTKGNLTAEESTLLTRAVSELRMEFVEISREVAKAVQEGRAQSVPMSGAGGPGGMGPTGGVIAPGGGGANLHFPS